MGQKSFKVNVNPDVMKWARNASNLGKIEVSRLLNISTNTIDEWERGTKIPTFNSLKKIASFYGRPLAAFFLPEPPYEPPLPTDFRTLPNEERRPLSRKSMLAIRKVRYIQSIATELLEAEENLEEKMMVLGEANLTEPPELLAARERSKLGVTIEEQMHFRDKYEAFRKWREVLESRNIMVHQAKIPLEEVRGFSLLDNMVPRGALSFSDSIHAKIFTLCHEFAHILLGVSGLCIPKEASFTSKDSEIEIEKFCNHFAGSLLLPRDALIKDEDAKAIASHVEIQDLLLERISTRYKVSTQVVLRRLLICETISKRSYQDKLEKIQKTVKRKKKGKFKMAASRRCMLENGRFFVSLALDAMAKEKISYSDVADYLSIDLKNLGKVQNLV